MPPFASYEFRPYPDFSQRLTALANALMTDAVETLTYDVPRRHALAAEFARSANISANGKTVEIGSFTATKIGALSRFIFKATPEAGANWEIRSSRPATKGAVAFSKASLNDPAEIISVLAQAEAGFHLTEPEKQAALRAALQARLDALAPQAPR